MKRISSVSDLMEIIHCLDLLYAEMHFDDYGCATPLLVFRGHSKDTYKLIPSVLRDYAFSLESDILEEFITDACRFVDGRPEETLKYAEYAQHFGVPTRLLDWTANPLTALFFACRNNLDADASVWILNYFSYGDFSRGLNPGEGHASPPDDILYKKLIDPSNMFKTINGTPIDAPDLPIVYAPKYKDLRMSMQSSYFMLWGLAEKPLDELVPAQRCTMLPEDLAELRGEELLLLRAAVESSSKRRILYELDLLGINEKTIFPGLDGLGQYLARKHRDMM